MEGETDFVQDAAGDEVLLDNSLEHGRVTAVIPRPFRVDQSDGTPGADAEATDFAAIHQALRFHEAEFLEPAFQEFPGRQTCRRVAATRFGRVRAEQDMPPIDLQTKRRGDPDQIWFHAAMGERGFAGDAWSDRNRVAGEPGRPPGRVAGYGWFRLLQERFAGRNDR